MQFIMFPHLPRLGPSGNGQFQSSVPVRQATRSSTVNPLTWLALLAVFFELSPGAGFAQGTAFTYQGRLTDGPGPATGAYDLRFTVYDAAVNGTVIAGPLTNAATSVNAGLFTVMLDFGSGVFNGQSRWLELAARTNGSGAFGIVVPRQQLTAAPYAILAGSASNLSGTVSASQLTGIVGGTNLSGTYSGALIFNNPSNSFAGNGGQLTNVNALTIGGVPSSSLWLLGGNTVGTGQFLGPTNNQALELVVNGTRGLRLEPTTNGSPNVIGGALPNMVDGGVAGAFIGGGGSTNYRGSFSSTNRISSDFGVIGGGVNNWIQGNAADALIGGGANNLIQDSSLYASIVGGDFNTITNSASASIGGGFANTITNAGNSTIGGGFGNRVVLQSSGFIGGGDVNAIGGTPGSSVGVPLNQDNVICGGLVNFITQGSAASVIGGGEFNVITNAIFAAIPGGLSNVVAGEYSLAAGFNARANYPGCFVWGDSTAGSFAASSSNQFLIRASDGVGIGTTAPEAPLHVAKGSAGTVTADTNSIAVFEKSGSKGFVSVLGPASSEVGVLFGNPDNNADGGITFNDALVPHGLEFRTGTNVIQMSILANGNVGIGTIAPNRTLHLASTGDTELGIQSADGGGHLWSLQSSGVIGTSRDGSFQIIDRTPGFNVDRFQISTNGNVGIGTANPTEKLDVGGNIIASGSICASNGVNCASDRNAKENFTPVNSREILDKVAQLPVSHWNYKTDPQTPHLGPMAQDFYAAFGVGSDERHIAVVDEGGVALAAIQGLNQKLEASQAEVQELREEVASLRTLVQELSHRSAGGSR